MKRRGFDFHKGRQLIVANSEMVLLDESDAFEAGQIHAQIREIVPDFGMADAIVLAAARKLNAKVVTGDPHFTNVKDTILI